MSEHERRVVVTGLGTISPLGLNVADTWKNILAGQSGVQYIDDPHYEQFSSRIAALVKNFDAANYMDPKDARRIDLFVQYGVAAAVEAVADAKLDLDQEDLTRIGVMMGSGIGGLTNIEKNHDLLLEKGPRKVSPFFIPGAIINMLPGIVSMRFGFKGPNLAIVTACTTGTHNIGQAARMIMAGDADIMVAGGAEMASTPLGLAGFAACRALSTRNDSPQQASRPFDKNRDGFVLGDGAAVLVLEDYNHAIQRGATIYAELAGFGMSADAYHMTAPDESARGSTLAMHNALIDAQMSPEDIDYINAHATATMGDTLEVLAIKKVFGEHAYRIPVSATKSMTGHLLGATGAIEAIFSVLAIRDKIAPPTINLDEPDEGCDLNFVAHKAQEHEVNAVLSNSLGFGGTNGALIFRRLD